MKEDLQLSNDQIALLLGAFFFSYALAQVPSGWLSDRWGARRLALLSAWLEDRPFCILDECAANQDPSFKRIFYAKLLPEMRAAGKGLLVISHDEDYFDAADRVIRLREGRVVDETPLGVGGVWT